MGASSGTASCEREGLRACCATATGKVVRLGERNEQREALVVLVGEEVAWHVRGVHKA